MKKEVADLWIAALESGEYVQTRGALHVLQEYVAGDAQAKDGSTLRAEGYCCLGVLCEVAIKNGLDLNRRPALDGHIEFFGNDSAITPKRVMDWASLGTPTGVIPNASGNSELELTNLNDSGKTFKEIAQIIRDNWEKL